MKFKAFACFILLLTLHSAYAQQQSTFYVVIGGFSIEENAQKLVSQASGLNIPAVYAMNRERNLYYVYVRATKSKDDAYLTLTGIQGDGFKDAWVFNGSLQGALSYSDNNENESSAPLEIIPESISVEVTPTASAAEAIPVTPAIVESTVKDEPVEIPETISDSPPSIVETAKAIPAGKPFVFKLTNVVTGSPVKGQVHLLESERASQYRGFNGNEKVYVVAPNNRGGKWYIVCQVIGFRPYKKSFTYSNPEQFSGASPGCDQEYVIPLELTRVKKGDYIEMDEVAFFENSNVLRPQSERALEELLSMLEENAGYQIKLHGHTNGNHEREIISRKDAQPFFVMEPGNDRSHGSAKLLSELRAETIRNYLMSKGIDGERISVRGEGGKQPIFDPKGTAASRNSRVEAEITKH